MYKFYFHTPSSIKESIKIFKNSDNPKYLAGGMTLLGAMKQKMSAPSDLIDLSNILELNKMEIMGQKLFIGSMKTHNEIAQSQHVIDKFPGLAELAKNIADNAVRNRGTIGGSICNADPAADYPAALLSIGADIVTNERVIKSSDFFIDMFETNLKLDEIVLGIELIVPEITKYYKFSSLASKYAIVGLFFTMRDNHLKFSVTGASNNAFIIKELENISKKDLIQFNVKDIDFNEYRIISDINASSDYKISLIKSLLEKAIKYIRSK